MIPNMNNNMFYPQQNNVNNMFMQNYNYGMNTIYPNMGTCNFNNMNPYNNTNNDMYNNTMYNFNQNFNTNYNFQMNNPCNPMNMSQYNLNFMNQTNVMNNFNQNQNQNNLSMSANLNFNMNNNPFMTNSINNINMNNNNMSMSANLNLNPSNDNITLYIHLTDNNINSIIYQVPNYLNVGDLIQKIKFEQNINFPFKLKHENKPLSNKLSLA